MLNQDNNIALLARVCAAQRMSHAVMLQASYTEKQTTKKTSLGIGAFTEHITSIIKVIIPNSVLNITNLKTETVI